MSHLPAAEVRDRRRPNRMNFVCKAAGSWQAVYGKRFFGPVENQLIPISKARKQNIDLVTRALLEGLL